MLGNPSRQCGETTLNRRQTVSSQGLLVIDARKSTLAPGSDQNFLSGLFPRFVCGTSTYKRLFEFTSRFLSLRFHRLPHSGTLWRMTSIFCCIEIRTTLPQNPLGQAFSIGRDYFPIGLQEPFSPEINLSCEHECRSSSFGGSVSSPLKLISFRDGRNSLKCFIQSIFHQCFHSVEFGLTANVLGRFAAEGHFSNAGVEHHQFEDSLAAPIPGLLAVFASFPPAELGGSKLVGSQFEEAQFGLIGLVRLPAFGTNGPQEPLGHNGHEA